MIPARLAGAIALLCATVACLEPTTPRSREQPGFIPPGSGSSSGTGTVDLSGSSSTSSGAGSTASTSGAAGSTATGSTSSTGGSTSSTGGASSTGGSTSSTGGSTSESSTSSSSSSSSSGICPPPGPAATVTAGSFSAFLLSGQVVTPSRSFAGQVLVSGDTLVCVDVDCSTQPDAAGATVIQTNGIILPGLIDTHNHILFNIFDETDWSPQQSYGDHNQWTNEPRYKAMVDAKQRLNGESNVDGGVYLNLNCEMEKYGEIKGLIAGTTSIVGAANPANKACYGTLARTIDQSPNGLGSDHVQVATLFPSTSAADSVCSNFTSGSTDAYLIHIGEGVDSSAAGEFGSLGTVTTTDGCLYAHQTTIVHGTALTDADFAQMADAGMSLTWSPKSNVFLYGADTDLSKTTDIPSALSHGLNVSLGPDWSIGGSVNLLDELRFAKKVDHARFGDLLSPEQLAAMVTVNPARALGLEAVLGSLEVGKKADLVVIEGDPAAPYDALLAATPREVKLVMVGGLPLYGDLELQPAAQSTPACEQLDICCRTKFLCVAQPGGTSTNKFDQSFATIQATLSQALSDYDAQATTGYQFAPLAPLVKCP